MNKFEVIYEFDGKKMWEVVDANDSTHAMSLILKKNTDNNIRFLLIEKKNGN